MRQLKISRRITSRESAALDKYLSEISRIQTLTPEQEVSLAHEGIQIHYICCVVD